MLPNPSESKRIYLQHSTVDGALGCCGNGFTYNQHLWPSLQLAKWEGVEELSISLLSLVYVFYMEPIVLFLKEALCRFCQEGKRKREDEVVEGGAHDLIGSAANNLCVIHDRICQFRRAMFFCRSFSLLA